MIQQVVLAIPDGSLASEAAALIAETDGFAVSQTVADSTSVGMAVADPEVTAAILYEDLGPLPVMELANEIARRNPGVGLILLAREKSPEVLEQALHAGFRDVVALPLGLEPLGSALVVASRWSLAFRDSLAAEEDLEGEGVGGAMVLVAGAKGGVGTTTLAVHLALQAARARGRSVCLVDFDLQTGDVGHLLDLSHRRSIGDLVDVAEELSARHIESTMFLHPSGMKVLLAPSEGEVSEEVSAVLARRLFGHLKFRYDVVIVDAGAIATVANTVAVEMADRVVVVTTPDGPSMRGTNRLVALWERLNVRKRDDVEVVVNRVSKDTDVQVRFLRKEIVSPCLDTVIPSAFRDIELATNTGVPDRLAEGGVRKAVASLGFELGVVPKETKRKRKRPTAAAAETGSIAIETTGLAITLLLVILLLWQMVLAGWTFVLAGHSAREGARQLAVGGDVREAVEEDLPSFWRDGLEIDEGGTYVEVTLSIPLLVPGIHSPIEIDSRSGTVIEGSGSGFGGLP